MINKNFLYNSLDDKNEAYKFVLDNIYKNKYFTNHGPLAIEFESSLCNYLSVKHAVTVSNETLALILSLVGLNLKGSVIIPALSYPFIVEAVSWSGLTPIICDIDKETLKMSLKKIKEIISEDTCAIISVDIWGNRKLSRNLLSFANQHHLKIINYSSHARENNPLTEDENLENNSITRVYSLAKNELISSASEGGCITTNDNNYATRLRNIRSSYGIDKVVHVPITANGRFSEFQAGMGLWSLSKIQQRIKHYSQLYNLYNDFFDQHKPASVYKTMDGIQSNFQNFVIVVEESQSRLIKKKIKSLLLISDITELQEPVLLTDIFQADLYNKLFKQNSGYPNAEKVSKNYVNLPISMEIDVNLAKKITHEIADILLK